MMTDPKPKTRKPKLELREPAKPLASAEQPRALPPDHPVMEIFRLAAPQQTPEQSVATRHPPPATHHPPPTSQSVAPDRDFVRVPNSVVRDALPAGLFKGESKKTYDALYQRTRGAVVPRRAIRATLAEVMAWSNVSHNTLKAHLKHLAAVGLVKVHYVRGDNTGAEYEVLTPEEAPPTTHHPPTNHLPTTSQNLGPPTSQNLVVGGGGQTVDSKEIAGEYKTSFKTNTERDDDEALADFVAAVKKATVEITGRELSPAERQRWAELADVLITELKIAAGRTTVSSVPAFLAEHLRRRLWKKEKRQIDQEAADSPAAGTSRKVDASKCSDCFGTGMYYPDGFEKGVARCRHEKIAAHKEE
jgi:hypothetical protein